MPPDAALTLAERFRQRLLLRERAAAVRLVNAYGSVYQRLQPQINALIAELDRLALQGSVPVWKVGRLGQLQGLRRQIEAEVNRYAAIAGNEIEQGARLAIVSSQQDAHELVKAALPGVAEIDARILSQWNRLNPQAVETMLGFLDSDSPLMAGLRDNLGKDVADSVAANLLEGITLGYNPRKVAGLVRQQLGLGLVSSLRTARTAQLYAYREATRASYMANSEIVKGWTWRSARLGNTCMACLARDGTKHTNEETLNDHHNGKCVMVPIVIDYADLGLDVPRRVEQMDTGEDWFRSQPEAMQKQMMGPEKWKAWKEDKFAMKDMAHTHEDSIWGNMVVERTLKDLVEVG